MESSATPKEKWSRVLVICTIIGSIAALVSVPEVRRLLKLDSESSNSAEEHPVGTPLPGATPTPAREATQPRRSNYAIRVFNCDDGGRALLNGSVVAQAGFGDDTGWVDITGRLKPGANLVKFEVLNDTGAITYGFSVRKDKTVVFSEECGVHHQVGCEDNRQDFSSGVARGFTYHLELP